jgi:hypothetical protein
MTPNTFLKINNETNTERIMLPVTTYVYYIFSSLRALGGRFAKNINL